MFFEEAEGQLFVTSDKGVDLPGLNLVITPAKTGAPIGLLQRLCGATLLHRFVDPGGLLRILGTRSSQLSRVEQEIPGFTGSVIHVGHGPASHLAILVPWGNHTPIGRFFFQHGPGIYLASAMTDQLAVIRERLASLGRVAPVPSAGGSLLIPPHLLGGARLALFERAASCESWDVSSPIFATAPAWA